MNRREALKLMGASLAGALVPTWFTPRAEPIDMMPFCRKPWDATFRCYPSVYVSESRKPQTWRCDQPYVQWSDLDTFRYATDGKICVRMPTIAPVGDEDAALPPAHNLPWWKHATAQRGWTAWPDRDYIVTRNATCLGCDGHGVTIFTGQCPTCQGGGMVAMGGLWHSELAMRDCERCHGTGNLGAPCSMCGGTGGGTLPSVLCVYGGQVPVYVAAHLAEKIRRLPDVEFRVPDAFNGPVVFRFRGGDGLVMPVDRVRVEENKV